MLAATYSETGQNQKALDTAQQALALAVLQHKDDQASVLRGNIALYGAKMRQAKGPGIAK